MISKHLGRVLPLVVMLGLTATGQAQCPNLAGSTPLLLWTTVDWEYEGSYFSTTGMAYAMEDWSDGQTKVQFCSVYSCGGANTGVLIYDNDSLPSGVPGQTTIYSYEDGDPGCVDHPDADGGCTDGTDFAQLCYYPAMQDYSEIELSPTNIGALASSYSWTVNQMVEDTMSDEVGHVFWIG